MHGLSNEQEGRFWQYYDRLGRLGFYVASEPLEGQAEAWLAHIVTCLERLEQRLAEINCAYRTRGTSKVALYYLSSNDRADFGFGIEPTHQQRQANAAYRAQLDRRAAKWA